MSKYHRLSRREFLRMVGLAASATLGACTSQIPAAVAPTATAIPPVSKATPTAEPAGGTIKPLVPEMVLVEGGSFKMGDTATPDEQPVHTVKITRPFYVARYAVTFEEYDRFCDDTGKRKPGDRSWGRGKLPVIGTDWNDATAYCNWLSEKDGLTSCYSGKGILTKCDFSANGYRLPTEAEWEYAARGGQKSKGYLYAGSNNPDDVAWYAGNSGDRVHPVGEKQPNELGLYDMSGNMYEWCWDWYGKDYYASSPIDDPTGPPPTPEPTPRGPNKVRRSGSWRENADSIRVAFRSFDYMSYPGDNGFRLVRTKTQ
jgi:sulfatase modifying factor 1